MNILNSTHNKRKDNGIDTVFFKLYWRISNVNSLSHQVDQISNANQIKISTKYTLKYVL
jgi:hypothetical protein